MFKYEVAQEDAQKAIDQVQRIGLVAPMPPADVIKILFESAHIKILPTPVPASEYGEEGPG